MTRPPPAAHPVRVLARGATLACGVCGRRGLFRGWVHMVERCPRCGLRFERNPGDFVGAVGINTILNFGLVLAGLIAFVVVTYPDIPAGPWVFLVAAAYLPVPVLLYPVSKTLWLAVDLLMQPVREGEVRAPEAWEA